MNTDPRICLIGFGEVGQLLAADLRARGKSVLEKIKALEKLPPAKKTVRYHAPVSRPVHADEIMFE